MFLVNSVSYFQKILQILKDFNGIIDDLKITINSLNMPQNISKFDELPGQTVEGTTF
jgi:hypothetical protein